MDRPDPKNVSKQEHETKNDERGFLHDISSPLCTALLLIDTLNEQMEADGSLQKEADGDQIKKIMEALTRLNAMLKQRRQTLIQRGV